MYFSITLNLMILNHTDQLANRMTFSLLAWPSLEFDGFSIIVIDLKTCYLQGKFLGVSVCEEIFAICKACGGC